MEKSREVILAVADAPVTVAIRSRWGDCHTWTIHGPRSGFSSGGRGANANALV